MPRFPMKVLVFFIIALVSSALGTAAVRIDQQAFGVSLGGWSKRGDHTAEYPLSGATYRTYKPEITPTPDGGIFVSLRIDHVRGWLSSDDHAVLEITVSAKGNIESAQSTLAIQGRAITTDIIRSGTGAGAKLAGVDRAVQIGTDLVADLTAKMLHEKLVEAGRVSYPSVLRHNYNLLFQAIRTDEAPSPDKPAATNPDKPAATNPDKPAATNPDKPAATSPDKPAATNPDKQATGETAAPGPDAKPAEPEKTTASQKTAVKLEIRGLGETPKSETAPKK